MINKSCFYDLIVAYPTNWQEKVERPPHPFPKMEPLFWAPHKQFHFFVPSWDAVYAPAVFYFFGKVASFPCVVPSWNGVFSHWNCCVQAADMTLEFEKLLKFTQILASKCSRAFRNALFQNAVLGVQWRYQSVWEVDQGLISYGF